jgi:hypothetical protein
MSHHYQEVIVVYATEAEALAAARTFSSDAIVESTSAGGRIAWSVRVSGLDAELLGMTLEQTATGWCHAERTDEGDR